MTIELVLILIGILAIGLSVTIAFYEMWQWLREKLKRK